MLAWVLEGPTVRGLGDVGAGSGQGCEQQVAGGCGQIHPLPALLLAMWFPVGGCGGQFWDPDPQAGVQPGTPCPPPQGWGPQHNPCHLLQVGLGLPPAAVAMGPQGAHGNEALMGAAGLGTHSMVAGHRSGITHTTVVPQLSVPYCRI